MTSQRNFFHVLDEGKIGTVQFGDASIIYDEGKGRILVSYANGDYLNFEFFSYMV